MDPGWSPSLTTETLTRPAPARGLPGRKLRGLLLHPGLWAAVAAAIGLGMGLMVERFRLRYFKLIIGALFALAVLRLPTYLGVGLFLVVCSYPASLWIGDTNLAFILFLLVVWLVRVALGREEQPTRTYLDWAILFYIGALALSLVHVESGRELGDSWVVLRHILTPIGMYFLIVNAGRSERRLLVLTEAFLFGVTTVFFSVFMQRYYPGLSWLPRGYLGSPSGARLFGTQAGAIRLGGVYTHALLSDVTAIAFVIRIYLAAYYRRNAWMRAYHWFFALLSAYVLSMTGNRGGLLVLLGGMAIYLWTFRRQYTLTRVVAGAALVAVALVGSEFLLFRFQTEGSLLGRLFRTQLVRGIPETRLGAWDFVWNRIAESPWIGHGPVYPIGETIQGVRANWPHNAYFYYLYTAGVVGLLAFLVICWRVVRHTRAGHGFAVRDISLARGLTAVFHVSVLQFLAGQMRTDHQRRDLYVYVMWTVFALAILAREVWDSERSGASSPAGRRRPPGQGELTGGPGDRSPVPARTD